MSLALMAVEFSSYSDFDIARDLTLKKQKDIISKYPSMFKLQPYERNVDDKKVKGEEITNIYGQHLIDSTDANYLSSIGISFRVKKFKGTIPYKVDGIEGNINNLHIHLPNNVLSSFNEVWLLDDACTDTLQDKLDEGWSILCVCPPLNARRPDYMLGRQKEPNQ